MKILRIISVVTLSLAALTGTCCAAEEEPSGEYEYYEKFIDEAEFIAKLMYRECRGVQSDTQKAAVAWVVLNRVDDKSFPDTVEEVILQENQFASIENAELIPELYALSIDVLKRYHLEKTGLTNVGRVLPQDYLWFAGREGINTFRNRFKTEERWDFSLLSPYAD